MKILIARTDKIGDVLLITPVLSALRKKFPSDHISVLISPYTREIIEGNPNIDDVIFDDCKSGLSAKLKKEHFDTVVVLFPTFRVALAAFLAGIPRRIGTGYRIYSFLFNYKIYVHRSSIEKHEVEYNFDLVRPLGVELKDEKTQIFYGDSEKEYAGAFLKNLNIAKNDTVIAVHPCCGGSSWNWPIENYAKLCDELMQSYNAKILITGSEKDKQRIDKMLSLMNSKPYLLIGKTTIKQLAAVLSGCSLFISSSTGPMHIAAAVGIPVVSFFSPVFVCSPKRWGTWRNKQIIFRPPASKKNIRDSSSMKLIPVSDVIASVSGLLGLKRK